MNAPTLVLAQELIRRDSVTPRDSGCCELIANRLSPLGFSTEFLRFGEVTNLWAVREGGAPGPTLVLAGHTDVVPRDRLTNGNMARSQRISITICSTAGAHRI